MTRKLRSPIMLMTFAAIIAGVYAFRSSWSGVDHQMRDSQRLEDSYADALDICSSLMKGELEFVNRNLRYGRFVRTGNELEFHYMHEPGIERIVHWGNADARTKEIRNAGMLDYLGMSLLSDSDHEEQRIAGIEHDYPRIYDVVFQTNRNDGKVAIMDGGSNVFPYTDKSDEP